MYIYGRTVERVAEYMIVGLLCSRSFFALKDLYKITGNKKKERRLVPGAFSIVVSQGFRLVWREALRS